MAANEIESLNSEAAALFSSSSFLEAGRRWCQLLRLLTPHLHVAGTTLEQVEAPPAGGTSSLNHSVHFVAAPSLRTVEEEHVFSAFGFGIVYAVPGAEPGQAWGEKEYRKAVVATCYNMALSHHLHGLQDANNALSMEKALTTYRLARALLQSTVMDVSTESQDVLLLALAIANNEGHVLSSRYEMFEARECWLDMQWLLQFAVPSPQVLHFFVTTATYPSDQAIFALHAPLA